MTALDKAFIDERSARNLIRLIRPFALLRVTHATGSLGEPGLCKQHTSNMRESVVLLRNRFGRFNINLERRALLSHRESSVRKRDFNSFRVEGDRKSTRLNSSH